MDKLSGKLTIQTAREPFSEVTRVEVVQWVQVTHLFSDSKKKLFFQDS